MMERNQISYALNQTDGRKQSEIPLGCFASQQVNDGKLKKRKKPSVISDSDSDELNGLHMINSEDEKERQARLNQILIDKGENYVEEEKYSFLTTFILLVIAVLVSGLKGNGFLLVDISHTNSFILRAFWRQLLTTLLFIPGVFLEYSKEKREEIEELRLYSKENVINKNNIKNILICGFLYAIWVGTLSFGVFRLSMTNAYMFNNIFPLFLLLSKLLFQQNPDNTKIQMGFMQKKNTNPNEIAGGIISLIVLASLCIEDLSVSFPEMIALIGAICAAAYYTFLQNIIYELPWMLAVQLLSLAASIFLGLYSYLFEGSQLNFNEEVGLFGVFTERHILLNLIISLLTGVVSVHLFSLLHQKVGVITIDIAIMCEVFSAWFIAFCLEYEGIPSFEHFALMGLYILGTSLLAIGKNQSETPEINLSKVNQQADQLHHQQIYSEYPVAFIDQTVQSTSQQNDNPPSKPSSIILQTSRNTFLNFEKETKLGDFYRTNIVGKVSSLQVPPTHYPTQTHELQNITLTYDQGNSNSKNNHNN